MTTAGVAPGWYPDPDGSGGQRYFDGATWTAHRLPPPVPVHPGHPAHPGYGAYPGYPAYPGYGYGGWTAAPPWKGAQLGRPLHGPGALADPGRRLAARLLDGLLSFGVMVVLGGITIAIVAPHVGPLFPRTTTNPNANQRVPGFLWIELAVMGCAVLTCLISVAYETFATSRYGRTLGKAWLHIRPLRLDGTPLGGWRAFGRSATRVAAEFMSWIGLLDPLWCLWDDKRQCLHDKVVDTIVVNDA